MRIGISSSLHHETPKQWASQLKDMGCRSVVFPVDYTAPENLIADYADAARAQDLMIAEVGIWRNVFALDPRERMEARKRAVGQLRLADELGARCCVNIAGTFGGPVWDGGYRENFSRECWDQTVEYIRGLLDEVRPIRTEYSIEPMPWMYPTGPDEYLKLLKAVDRPCFGVHLDAVNMVNTPERYFFLDEFLEECFDKLGRHIRSCHLKDIRLKNELTFQLEETSCGNGALDIVNYCRLINRCDSDMPVILEHLDTDSEYKASLSFVLNELEKGGVAL